MTLEAATDATFAAEAAHKAQFAASWKILRRLGYRKSDATNFRAEFFVMDGKTDHEGLAAWKAMSATAKALREADRVRTAFFGIA